MDEFKKKLLPKSIWVRFIGKQLSFSVGRSTFVLSYENMDTTGIEIVEAASEDSVGICVKNFAMGDLHGGHVFRLIQTHAKLKYLAFINANISSHSMPHLANSLSNGLNKLSELTIHENDIGDEGCEILAAAIPKTNLGFLSISECKVGEKGTIALCEAIKKTRSLCQIGLSDNLPATNLGVRAIADMIECSNVTRFSYGNVDLTDEQLLHIGEGIHKNTRFNLLAIHENDRLTEDGVKQFMHKVGDHENFKELFVPEKLTHVTI